MLEGWVGEYAGESADLLRIGLSQGITGWVAANKTAQILPDAARDYLRYVSEFVRGTATKGGGQPRVEFVRELVGG